MVNSHSTQAYAMLIIHCGSLHRGGIRIIFQAKIKVVEHKSSAK